MTIKPCSFVLATLATGALASAVQAATITFDLTNPPGQNNTTVGEDVDGLQFGSFTDPNTGVVITLDAGAGNTIESNSL
ncbi:MAG: hypothetical protein AAGK78_15275, partial [Planctomycetota bacterium]